LIAHRYFYSQGTTKDSRRLLGAISRETPSSSCGLFAEAPNVPRISSEFS